MIKTPTLSEERHLWRQGYKLVCGVDEVGRGSFAGPVVTAAVIFQPEVVLPAGINDSKLLSAKKRLELDSQIKQLALAWFIDLVDVPVINELGIGQATQLSFINCVQGLKVQPDFILIDGLYISGIDKIKQKAIIHGDQLSLSIAAASIIAKVYRDRLMEDLAKQHPEFGWDKNKGYGTRAHREAMKQYGLSKQHRRSFSLEKFL
ncbi:ribonuclease HII [Candidatus Daviesbacteria bacterium RIFCSPLOWO2_02_FULL_40_8]|uniref:Ribonuclease HII n=1 Tax=Candidatus Daviesbacteria bacterium RIFCSPLOWO2_01_FULL_40_24 TaxID=1797787 RepID=A0A1F5MJ27_9BACT|nr:MAG: ribonuclease HII [Candidatus Daviesbacteria bacterium RIFCSPHIGHO2_01_FULL_41_45]OGE34450.1 MAG: ribonuclease HII [Candidatus Daviesbacteria bacterium RIFCSPHIGHO2_02_FULL_41_14]OGE65362.1 MAG: ribonuclease HII [Candidatus Daviesbacteria bacterium RIFCSPLOWO2_01_FULL_40_24]OGE66777.1 MAG: ribonuclease HII [Candidatus Daviesbacteria bacterium RIFCSPLOWO2_02_FULL_40_8]